eukprot:scaffold89534_cov27-Tisochrysis_lutea.AAC.4
MVGAHDCRRDALQDRRVRQVEELGDELDAKRRANGRSLGAGLCCLLAKDFEKVVEHFLIVEALDEHEEGDATHPTMQRIVQTDLAEELHEQQRVA